ncbi:TadE/TadG family type IV pilus assembly protein [uncultured Massilia sp.]|uniref:TadE/TadG family type IV pilus assembly protein n=1 Tax=uncultured Massilia sp. TaxID=169973 RepID=UPI0035A3522C
MFFALFFGIVEMARAMYIINTLQEVTRRAAAFATNADFSNAAIMQGVKEHAIFRNSPGFLVFAQPVADTHIVIDYLWIQRIGGTLTMLPIPANAMPANPAANFANCLANPYSESCIRLVRVRVCETADGDLCEPVGYQALVSLVPFSFGLPPSVTIVTAETLGMPAGVPTCEC